MKTRFPQNSPSPEQGQVSFSGSHRPAWSGLGRPSSPAIHLAARQAPEGLTWNKGPSHHRPFAPTIGPWVLVEAQACGLGACCVTQQALTVPDLSLWGLGYAYWTQQAWGIFQGPPQF